MGDLEGSVDGVEFGSKDGCMVWESGTENGLVAVRGLEDRCRPCLVGCKVGASVFRAVSEDEVVVRMVVSEFVV